MKLLKRYIQDMEDAGFKDFERLDRLFTVRYRRLTNMGKYVTREIVDAYVAMIIKRNGRLR